MISGIVLIEIASCQNRNAPSLEITRRNVVDRGRRSLVHRQDFAVSARIKRRISAAGPQGNITAEGNILKTRNRSQRSKQMLYKTLPRLDIRVLRCRESDRAN